MRWVVVVTVGCGVFLGCAAGPLPMPPDPTPPEQTIPITEAGVGPLTAATAANLVELRRLLVGYDVVPVNNLDGDSELPALEYQVFDGDKRLFDIVPTEQGGILSIHVDSPRIVFKDRPWRVGATFSGAVTKCECWGGAPMCFKEGEHIGVSIKHRCHGLTDKLRRAVTGKQIERLVWSAKPLGGNADSDVDTPTIDDP